MNWPSLDESVSLHGFVYWPLHAIVKYSIFFFKLAIRCKKKKDFGSASGYKFNSAARVGSGQTISCTGRVRASV